MSQPSSPRATFWEANHGIPHPRLDKGHSRGRLAGMNAVTLEYPEAWLAPLGTDAEHFAKEAKLAAAMKLFEKGRFTNGQAAQFAGVGRSDFFAELPRVERGQREVG